MNNHNRLWNTAVSVGSGAVGIAVALGLRARLGWMAAVAIGFTLTMLLDLAGRWRTYYRPRG